MLRFHTDHVTNDKDPISRLANLDFQWLMRGVNEKNKPIVLNGKLTAEQYYFGIFASRFNDEQELFEVESNLAKAISVILKNRGSWNSEPSQRQRKLDEIYEVEEIEQSLDILREIFDRVHPAFFQTLFSRWAWVDDDVNLGWLYPINQLKLKVYATKQDHQNGIYSETLTSKLFVDKNLPETLLTILRWNKTEYKQYGYQSVDHYEAAKKSWFNYWSRNHYISCRERRQRKLNSCPLNVLTSDKAAERQRKTLKRNRIEYEFNNSLIDTSSTGTVQNEFLHMYINYDYLHKCGRSILLSNIQHSLTLLTFNEAHFDYLCDQCKYLRDNEQLKTEIQSIYTEINLLPNYLSGKLTDDQNRKLIEIIPKLTSSSGYNAQYVEDMDHELPKKRQSFSNDLARNNSLLLEWVLLNVKSKKIKLKKGRNKRTKRNEYALSDNDGDNDSDNDYNWDLDEDEEKMEELDKDQKQRLNEAYSKLINKMDKRCSNYLRIKHNHSASNCEDVRSCYSSPRINKILKDLTVDDITYYELEQIPFDLLDDAVDNLFKEKYTKGSICFHLRQLGMKVSRYLILFRFCWKENV